MSMYCLTLTPSFIYIYIYICPYFDNFLTTYFTKTQDLNIYLFILSSLTYLFIYLFILFIIYILNTQLLSKSMEMKRAESGERTWK